MKEGVKTLVFIAAALVAVLVATVTFPRPIRDRIDARIGKPLFPEFQDPLKAKELRIADYSPGLEAVEQFAVAEKRDRWVIPSHHDYPADAEKKIEQAATALIDLKVIGVARTDLTPTEQETLGVVEPTDENAAAGRKGLGKMITMRDENGDVIASLIIGKSVKDAEGQRFVRVPGQNVVYALQIDPESFSTRFEDWIQQDLLQVGAQDVRQIALKDYSIQRVVSPDRRITPKFQPRLEIEVTYDEQEGKWAFDKLEEYRDNRMQPTELLTGEQLNQERINQLKDSLLALKIVDVQPKPKGLDADLKADKNFMDDQEAQESLASRGFFSTENGEIYSSEGEVLVRSKEGVEYVLRFGETTDLGTANSDDSLSRFLFIVARLDESQFPQPEMLPLPPAPQAAPAETPAATDAEPAPAPPSNAPAPPAAETPAGPAQTPAPPSDDSSAPVPAPTLQPEPVAPVAETPPAAEAAPEVPVEPAPETPATEPAVPPTPPVAEPPATEPAQPPVVQPNADAVQAAYEAARDHVMKENQRRIDEYNNRRKKAENRVKELNFRFAGWYYVISEEMYKKIHLNRADVITESEAAKEEGFGIDAFRDLEKTGVEGKSEEHEPGEGDFPPGMMPGMMPPGMMPQMPPH